MGLLHREGAKYVATDYTSFESLFVRELMEACEFELYAFMTSRLPSGADFMHLVREVLGGLNLCVFKDFRLMLEACRMSGEMCTSLGNGFSNLMFMKFICKKKGCKHIRGVVEGDDGLFTMVGTPPTKEDFALLGLIIKVEVHDTISTASFCGLVFDRVDRINVTDPRKVLNNFGWVQRTYASVRPHKLRQLMRCKALSLAYQYPGCPIIAALGAYGIRVTTEQNPHRHSTAWLFRRYLDRKGGSLYEREQMLLAMKTVNPYSHKKPGLATRLLVEKLYCISISTQIAIEDYLGSLMSVQVLDHESIDSVIPALWKQHYRDYSFVAGRLDRDMVFPVKVWSPLKDKVPEWNDEDFPVALSNRKQWRTAITKLSAPQRANAKLR